MKKAINQSLLILILNGISILTLILMVISLFSYSSTSRRLETANENRFLLTYNANRFMNGSAYLTNEVRAFAATGDKAHYDNYWNEINNLQNRDLGVAAMQEIGITQEEQGMIDEMSGLSNQLVPLEEEAMENVQDGKMQQALDYVYGKEYQEAITQINALKEQFLEALDTRSLASVQELSALLNQIKTFMVLALMLIALMQMMNMFVVRKQLLRPVLAIRDQMVEISGGNLSSEFALRPDTSEVGMLVQSIHETKHELKKYIGDIDFKLKQMASGNMDLAIENNYRGEFLPIQEAMREILDALNETLLQINITSGRVSSEAQKMSNEAQTLSQGAIEQASAVERLSESIRELSGQVDSTSADAEEARGSTTDAAEQLAVCNRKMQDLKVAIGDISKASQKIEGIIKTIEDISFQTNILALNAAVEAARAGEAGKGFAIVADEVQSLAIKSSAAAKDITDLIENSIQLVDQGAALSVATTESLATGVSGAQKSTKLVERIAKSAMQQSQSLRELTNGMEQISQVVQMNAEAAETSAAAAGELNGHAEELQKAVLRFQLRKG
ncbi:MAG: HAMP domain-containing protein [Eubacterium sp.]|jgi:methyl-accepting chemotaxis protein|nr:HAMP domain-containing protein [Eubacterium sp.]NBI84861.1 methyl-accepting chemotaxis protein [Lachnospiraceae bacterium]